MRKLWRLCLLALIALPMDPGMAWPGGPRTYEVRGTLMPGKDDAGEPAWQLKTDAGVFWLGPDRKKVDPATLPPLAGKPVVVICRAGTLVLGGRVFLLADGVRADTRRR